MGAERFNWQKAWVEAARPAYEQHILTNQDIMGAYHLVVEHYRDIHQDRDHLGIPWRKDKDGSSTDRLYFQSLDLAELAFASRVIYFLGHWWPGDYGLGPLFRETFPFPGREWGAHWKFSRLADQTLREMLEKELGTDEFGQKRHGHGWHWEVHEGAAWLCYSSRSMWTWYEVNPAAHANLNVLLGSREAVGREVTDNQVWQFMERVRKHEREGMPEHVMEPCWWWPERWRPFVDHRFMEPEGEDKYQRTMYVPK